jgi:hypothetical protein
MECVGSATPLIRYAICFQAPRTQSSIEAKTPEKHFALLALSYFNFTLNPAPCTSTQLTFEDLVLDESLIKMRVKPVPSGAGRITRTPKASFGFAALRDSCI